MNILGIDYGRKKVGFAYSSGVLSEPLEVYGYSQRKSLFDHIQSLISKYEIEKILIGVSEGEMAKEIELFGDELKKQVIIPIVYHDETLSSLDAKHLSIQAGQKRKKRKELEDAYAAAIVLQDYLDSR